MIFGRKKKSCIGLPKNSFKNISFENIQPDKKNNWINLADNDFESLIPLGVPRM